MLSHRQQRRVVVVAESSGHKWMVAKVEDERVGYVERQRVRHTDIWRRILDLLMLFERSADRSVVVMYVKAHDGSHGNERADKLAKEGAKLRFDLMELAAPHDTWYHEALALYWTNRKINND